MHPICFDRKWVVLLVIAIVPVASSQDRLDPATAAVDDEGIHWYDTQALGIEGKAWSETKLPFDRLPAKAEGVVRPAVWGSSRHSAGMCVRFATDAETIRARWTLTSSRLAMDHMPATGVSGLDLYVQDEQDSWRWLGVGRPKALTNTATLVKGLAPQPREYLLYLPLYNGVSSLEIGISSDRFLAQTATDVARKKPLVFYGTSITQGGCASRPGMVHTAILSRRFDRPVINLGFSGNGTMDPEISELLTELEVAVYVIDCLPNMAADVVAARSEPLVHTLRAARPDVPILLVEDRTYTDAFLVASKRQRNLESRRAFRAAYDRLKADGVSHLHYLSGESLLGADGEDTVDGSHPTDLGFWRMANRFEEALRRILSEHERG
jgi:hypothetical protein